MGQETATTIDTLNPAWPLDTDQRRFGAQHLRTIKSALQATFPQIAGPILLSTSELNQFNGFDVDNIDAATLDGRDVPFLRNADNLNAGTINNARVPQSAVTQYEGVLAINTSQLITDVLTRNNSFSVEATMDEAIVICNSAGVINVTLVGGMIAVGDTIGFIRRGAGAVNFLAGAGQTINTPTGLSILLQHGKAAATYIAANTWELGGNV